ncbi:MAG: PDZ domain-containing protein [Candidatus Cloacimonetes bacterium]|nr:PDZ domain-containing protein [Candidatus Cloacimonadota bacterium]
MWRYSFVILVSVIFSACVTTQIGSSSVTENGNAYLGVSAMFDKEVSGQLVRSVVPESPAETAGLIAGDIILKIDGVRLNADTLFINILRQHSAGDEVNLLVRREKEKLTLPVILGNRNDYFARQMKRGGRTHWAENNEIFPRIIATLPVLHSLMDSLQMHEDYNNLTKAFTEESKLYQGFYKLNAVNFILRDPIKFPIVAELLNSEFDTAAEGGLTNIIELAAKWTDVPLNNYKLEPLATYTTWEEHVRQIEKRLSLSDSLLGVAFAKLDSTTQATMLKTSHYMLNKFVEHIYIDSGDKEEYEYYYKLIHNTKSIDYGALYQASRAVASFYDKKYLQSLFTCVSALPDTNISLPAYTHHLGSLKDFRQTVVGDIVVGGSKDNIYISDAAVIIEPDGNDNYLNNCGATSFEFVSGDSIITRNRICLLIDFRGNDTYTGNRFATIATGLMGIGMLIDCEGDDVYQGDMLTQGSAFIGSGMLIDDSGNDRYSAQESGQGAAFFGFGLLQDSNGDDVYSGTKYCQAFSSTKAFGLLYDKSGNDGYYSAFKHPSGYGTLGIWDGWSQGCSVGLRSIASGGVALLKDASGDDIYRAGNFSQGVGYFFSLGMLSDDSGNDTYIGTRYVQGSGVHQSTGAFLEGSGNDRYEGRVAINQAGAWDIGAAVFIEKGGNDIYVGDGYAQGGAAMNGFVCFIDEQGNDSYTAHNSNGQGWSSENNTYSGGRGAGNIVFTLDLQGEDSYNLEGRANDVLNIDGTWGVFKDFQ